jgi:hypothetical protein
MNAHKLKPITQETIIYGRPYGKHYHLDIRCPMLQGEDFKRMHYTIITLDTIKRQHLKPCMCAYEDFEPHELLSVI